ncbi:hypothetical protein [Sphingomonas sp.]|jgi:hypothetical protein|nr:hypothetical protein [Sphingomonas sp.]HEX4694786.1 hypothetical protein [Sphingomonas sp.]
MDKDANKSADKREGSDRRQEDDPNFPGPERRVGDRRKGSPAPK